MPLYRNDRHRWLIAALIWQDGDLAVTWRTLGNLTWVTQARKYVQYYKRELWRTGELPVREVADHYDHVLEGLHGLLREREDTHKAYQREMTYRGMKDKQYVEAERHACILSGEITQLKALVEEFTQE